MNTMYLYPLQLPSKMIATIKMVKYNRRILISFYVGDMIRPP